MIKITGSTQRSFIFPTNLDAAFDFFSDIGRILHYLPHISIVKKYNEQGYRMLYRTSELSVYRISIYCDITSDLDQKNQRLRIKPFQAITHPIHARAGLYSLVSQGFFSSTSIFKPAGEGTQVDYELKLAAEMKVPLAIRFMPDGIVESLANNIMQKRMQEIIDGFIARSIRAYRQINQEQRE